MTLAPVDRPPMTRTVRKVFFCLLLGSVGLLAVLGLLFLLGVDGRFGSDRMLVSSVVTCLWSMVGFGLMWSLDHAARRGVKWALVVGWIASGLATVAAVGFMLAIWVQPWEDEFARVGGIAAVWLIALSVPLPFVSPTPLPRWARALVVLGTLYAAWIAFLSTNGILELGWVDRFVRSIGDDRFFRIHGAGVIFAFCGLLVAAVVQRTRAVRQSERGTSVPWRLQIPITCPRCGLAQSLAAGGGETSRCERCRLRIAIEIDEPRCSCGYALYRLTGTTCPECGREVPEADRWLSEGGGVSAGS